MADAVATQNSFAAGELSPTLYGRVDLASYHIGLARCRNAFVDYRGGVSNRPGTRLVGRVLNDGVTRLISFVFSNVQDYVLAFGDHTMRVIRGGGYVTEPTKAITRSGATYTSTAHGYSTGDWVVVTDRVPPAVVTVVNANQFTLATFAGVSVLSNSSTSARIYTLVTPWAVADLWLLKFTQSFDTMTITHPSYTPYNLTRTQHWVWTLTAITFTATILPPTITLISVTVSGTLPATANTGYGYVVTAVDANGQESNPSAMVAFQSFNMGTAPVTFILTWTAVTGAIRYNIYRTLAAFNTSGAVTGGGSGGTGVDPGAPTGYVGYSTDLQFTDSNIVPDFTKTPPTHQNPFASANYPNATTYFDQRKVYGGSNLDQQTLWMSRPGQYDNMDTSTPANDGDALTLTLSTLQAAVIKSLVPMPSGLLVFTSSGVYQVSGNGQYAAVKVSSAVARLQAYNGANDVPPIPLNLEVLYVQHKGSIVRNLAYNAYSTLFQTEDMTLLSNHLFAPHQIVDWAYAEDPFKLVWAVRDDGQLLSLTYVKDQKINGWARHDTFGLFESITSIEENNTDSVYVVVKRFLNGQWVRFIEQFQPRNIDLIENGWFVDCGLDYGLNYPNATITLSAATGVAAITADSAIFNSGMTGWAWRGGGGYGIATYVSPTNIDVVLLVDPTQIILDGATPPNLAPLLPNQWSLTQPVTTLTGLDHLNGVSVSILADGVAQPTQFVIAGTVTLAAPASRIIVGIPIQSQCATLDLEPSGASAQGKRKRVVSLSAKVKQTQGLKYGPNFNELTTYTGTVTDGIQPLGLNQTYDYEGQVCWQQDFPLPMTVLSIVPELSVGD